ncbi:conserved membrane protein of unknown function(Protein of unknown function DUF423,18-100) [Magnetospirillum sp. XM-1]|uniref:DUF423 domain-containing protein n=1 Tax=Magnetospirillum sp. XM-1 TaxID=1663591 RepID=UPI00073E0B92|nr:DUF423 domain-containing protein [Magnetospirillum sp. XM-1]CUW38774.1 conserved membrane protein of unknown function(Protein of unknown function DUF423,18-100) [Magnetospirillum sp. XM-1]
MRVWLMLAGLNGAMAVGFAAWGSHGLDGDAARWVGLGSQFQLLHAVALLGLARFCAEGRRLFRPAAALMVAGIVLFSGSLYAKALGLSLPVPMLTPLGGVGFILSWLLLVPAGWLADDHARI